MTESFDLVSYRGLLSELLARGYHVCRYADAMVEKRHLVLRHDIDMSLEEALHVAEIESALDVKAHYFVLVRTEMYNPLSASARNALQRLLALGHHIGLHLDASLYDNDPATLEQAARGECEMLEAAACAPVEVISFHRPTKTLLNYSDMLAGRLHTYQPRFFTEMGYCSDSRGAWHHGHPLDHAAVREGRALQLLTHPIWWTSDASSASGKILEFLKARVDVLDAALAANCSVHEAGRLQVRERDE